MASTTITTNIEVKQPGLFSKRTQGVNVIQSHRTEFFDDFHKIFYNKEAHQQA